MAIPLKKKELKQMSFREKSAWACLVTTLSIYGVYFLSAFHAYDAGPINGMDAILRFAAAVVAQIVVLIVAHVVFAVRSDEPTRESGSSVPDERDVAIDQKAFRNGYYVLAIAVMLSILAIIGREVITAAGGAEFPLTPYVIGHGLLLCFVIAESVKMGTQVFFYRRGL